MLPDAPGLNVLVISFDALRADALGLYGYRRGTSPNLDAFAQESLVFDNAYSAAPVTPTSFAAAFTGRYPYKVFIGWQLIPSVTLAEIMRDAGYRTFALINNVQLAAERHFDQGFEHFESGPWPDEELTDLAIRHIGEALAQDSPFFGWAHFISPHAPYEYRDLSAHLAGPKTEGLFAEQTGGEFDVENEQELRRVRDLYDGEVYFADHLFGRVVDFLKSSGALERTIVIVTADHGEEFMDHGQLQHNALFEELIRVPLVVRHPDVAAGSRTDAPWLNVDLMPMIASMTGAEAPSDIDGLDLRKPFWPGRHRIVTGMTNSKRYEILSESAGLKLMQLCTPEFSEALYDLNADPEEQRNIVLDRPDLADALWKQLENATHAEPCELIQAVNQGRAPGDLLSPEQIEELRSLGYIQ